MSGEPPTLSIPEIAARPEHVNYRTAQKMLRSSNARMQCGLLLVRQYRAAHDASYKAPGSMSCQSSSHSS